MILLKRAYDPASPKDGRRFLVERLWPRGITKAGLPLDGWLKDVAPSTELRKWFSHDPAKWNEFQRRYRAELKEKPHLWEELLDAARRGTLTLIFSSHDTEHNNAVANASVRFIIKRQGNPEKDPYWEEFDLRLRPGMNVIIALMDIAANPVDRFGKTTTPITYESNCLEEVCGSCAMLINGKAAMACSSLISKLEQPVRLEPLSRFPVIRDLAVDRSVLFENLKRVKAWVPVDGTYDLGPGPRIAPEQQEEMYPLSRCISCCLCLEVCPQVTPATGFVGAAIINQVRLFNEHPTGKAIKAERLHAMMGDGGIHECSYAQNCVRICPKGIPLTTSISNVYGQTVKQALLDFFRS